MRLLQSHSSAEHGRVASVPLAAFVGIAILFVVTLSITLTWWRRNHFPLKSSGRSATLNTMCGMAAMLLLWYPAMNAFQRAHNTRTCTGYFFVITSFVPLFALPLLIGYARYYWEWTTQIRVQKELARRFDTAARAANRSAGGGAPMPPVTESPQVPTNRKEFHAVATADTNQFGENARLEVERLRKLTSVPSCVKYALLGYLPTIVIACCIFFLEDDAVLVLNVHRCKLGMPTRIYMGTLIFVTLASIFKMHWATRGHLREDTFGIRKEYRYMVSGGLSWLVAWGSIWVAYPEGTERFDPGYLQVGGALHCVICLMLWPALRTFKYFQPAIRTRPRSSNVTLQMPLGVLSKHLRAGSGHLPGNAGSRHEHAGSRAASVRRETHGSYSDAASTHSSSSPTPSHGQVVSKAAFPGSFSGAAAFNISQVRLKTDSNASIASGMLAGRLSPSIGQHRRVHSGTSDGEGHAYTTSVEMSSSVGSQSLPARMLEPLPDRASEEHANAGGSAGSGVSDHAGAADRVMGSVAANPMIPSPSPPPPPPDIIDINARAGANGDVVHGAGIDNAVYDFNDTNPGVAGSSEALSSSHSIALEELENSRLPAETIVMVDVNAVERESLGEPGLEQLLQDRDGFMLFAKHLQSEFASEDCDEVLRRNFDGLSDGAMPLKRALDLMDMYITSDASYQVNLPGKQRDHIVSEVRTACEAAQAAKLDFCSVSVPKALFLAAQSEIFSIMENDSFARFQFTEDWQRWLTGATNEHIKIVGSTVASHDQKQPAHTRNTAAMATKPGALSQLQHWWGRVRRRGRGEGTKLLHMATSDNL